MLFMVEEMMKSANESVLSSTLSSAGFTASLKLSPPPGFASFLLVSFQNAEAFLRSLKLVTLEYFCTNSLPTKQAAEGPTAFLLNLNSAVCALCFPSLLQ
ncbi:hypothetical protein XENORESO_004194 [Xenotaenia resolanae]|uniref:Uncharacterized protein n=1 Tax=Xenotaenia resolanae TaxID=208358 RepID=A0ABV0WRA5_9TELE